MTTSAPVSFEQVHLVLAHLVRQDEDTAIASNRRDKSQPGPGVAGGGLDNRAAGLEHSALLSVLNHPQGNAVLHASARVEILHLRQHGRWKTVRHLGQPDKRCPTDGL
jgi:hypothetical protein